MMRMSSGIVCAVAGALSFAVACSWGGASDPNNHPDAGGAAGAVCGDGTCSATEINTCPQDCGSGMHGSNGSGSGSGSGSNVQGFCGDGICQSNESSATCTIDCPGGGSGSGALDCSDPTVILSCGECAIDMTTCTTQINATTCAPCFM
jgi:hypothetical protein